MTPQKTLANLDTLCDNTHNADSAERSHHSSPFAVTLLLDDFLVPCAGPDAGKKMVKHNVCNTQLNIS